MAEGHNTGTPGAHIYTTTDGKTFTQKFFVAGPHASLMGARMISETEGWAAGGDAKNQLQIQSNFYHTLDGGETWGLESVKGIMALGIDCADAKNCIAPGILVTQQCGLVNYKSHVPTPAPAPTPPPAPGTVSRRPENGCQSTSRRCR